MIGFVTWVETHKDFCIAIGALLSPFAASHRSRGRQMAGDNVIELNAYADSRERSARLSSANRYIFPQRCRRFPMLEMAGPDHVRFIDTPLCLHRQRR